MKCFNERHKWKTSVMLFIAKIQKAHNCKASVGKFMTT